MRKESTKIALEKLEKEYKGQRRKWEQWERLVNEKSEISFSTFRKYIKLEKVISKNEVSIEEIVELLNNCAGNDCYYCDWQYEVIDGKPYEIIIYYEWK